MLCILLNMKGVYMDKAVLLTKLNNCNDKTFELYDYYLNATSKSFSDASEEFNVCVKLCSAED